LPQASVLIEECFIAANGFCKADALAIGGWQVPLRQCSTDLPKIWAPAESPGGPWRRRA
jgi:hypothetical protein